MNTEEIDRVLRRTCAKDFDGVFSAGTLPEKPHLLVVNTDPAHRPGRHWVCMWMENGYGEYFDSFGQPPTANFERYLNRHCSSWTFNRRQLQSVINLLVNFADIIVFIIVCLEVEALICLKL